MEFHKGMGLIQFTNVEGMIFEIELSYYLWMPFRKQAIILKASKTKLAL